MTNTDTLNAVISRELWKRIHIFLRDCKFELTGHKSIEASAILEELTSEREEELKQLVFKQKGTNAPNRSLSSDVA